MTKERLFIIENIQDYLDDYKHFESRVPLSKAVDFFNAIAKDEDYINTSIDRKTTTYQLNSIYEYMTLKLPDYF